MARLRRQEEKSVYKTLSLLFTLLFLAACGGGGGGDGIFTNGSIPTISNVTLSPSEAVAGSSVSFNAF